MNRGVVAGVGLVGAVLIGGVAQAYVWRWDVGWLTYLSNSQFLWALWSFLVAWAWVRRGRVVAGVAAGAATGLAMIGSYYLVQWIVDGRHAATDQFSDAYGIAWTLAAVGGGGAVGVLGALAGSPVAARKAFGLFTMALVVGLGPLVWVAARGQYLAIDGRGLVVSLFAVVGVALLVVAARSCGLAAFVRSGALAVAAGGAALVGLFVLEHTVLYLTF